MLNSNRGGWIMFISKTTVSVLAFMAIASGSSVRADIDIDILGRGPVTVHVPACYVPGNPTPLVMALHGYGARGHCLEFCCAGGQCGDWCPPTLPYVPLEDLAEEFCFLYLYPDGSFDAAGSRWIAQHAG